MPPQNLELEYNRMVRSFRRGGNNLQEADSILPHVKALNTLNQSSWELHHPSTNLKYAESVRHPYQQIHNPAKTHNGQSTSLSSRLKKFENSKVCKHDRVTHKAYTPQGLVPNSTMHEIPFG